MIMFWERRSNNVVSEQRKEKFLITVLNKLVRDVNEIISKLSICNIYDHDSVDIKIEHKFKIWKS